MANKKPTRHEIINNKKDTILLADNIIVLSNNLVRDHNNNLYEYNGKIYDLVDKNQMDRSLQEFFRKYGITDCWKSGKINEITRAIESNKSVPTVEMDDNDGIVVLRNGIFDINDMTFKEFSPEYYTSSMIDVDYKKDDKDAPNFKKFLDHVLCGDKKAILNIALVGGYLLTNHTKANKMFLFDGDGGSGKTTLLGTFQLFFNIRQLTSLSIKQLASSGFDKENLLTSRLNVCSENKSEFLDPEEVKKITDGNQININRKYEKNIEFLPKFKVVLAANGLPKFNDRTDGMKRRLLIFTFKNQYLDDNEYDEIKDPEKYNLYRKDMYLFNKIKAERSAILNIFLSGLEKLRETNWQFPLSENNSESIRNYLRDTDSVREFLEDHYQVDISSDIAIDDIYDEYVDWYSINIQRGRTPKLASNNMGKRIKNIFKIDGYRKTIYDNFGNPTAQRTFYNLKKKVLPQQYDKDIPTDSIEWTGTEKNREPVENGAIQGDKGKQGGLV